MDKQTLINSLSAEERAALIQELQQKDKEDRVNRREAYEALRNQLVFETEQKLGAIVADVAAFKEWLEKEIEGFRQVMAEYGQLKNDDQQNFTLTSGDFRLIVKSSKVKRFDERADMAAVKLIDYLKDFVAQSDKGVDDPMYQLAMTLLERNKQGDLDYKSISKLYDMEDKFGEEYKAIMDLFRESNVVQATAVNYYFHKRDKDGVWRQVEPSFCRM